MSREFPVRCGTCGWTGRRKARSCGGRGSSFDNDGSKFGPCPVDQGVLHQTLGVHEARRLSNARKELCRYDTYSSGAKEELNKCLP